LLICSKIWREQKRTPQAKSEWFITIHSSNTISHWVISFFCLNWFFPYNFLTAKFLIVFFISAAPLLFPLFFQITTIRFAIKNKLYLDLLSIILMFTIQFSLTYPVFQSMSTAILYFLLVRFIESSWFVWVSQSNHIPMDVHDNDPYDSWLALQVIKQFQSHCINWSCVNFVF